MPKKQPKNAFFYYMLDFKDREARSGRQITLAEAATLAGASWKNMTPPQRASYEARAKSDKIKGTTAGEKFSSQGVPLSLIEKERKDKDLAERLMKKEIEDTVKHCYANDTLTTQRFYFMMANYFAKVSEAEYIPAELAISEYSLKNGVNNKFHTLIDPGALPIGMGFQVKQHSDDTHRLPSPPNAKGERNFGKIFENLLSFVQKDENGEYPPLYTHKMNLEMLKNIISNLQNEYFGDITANIRIYPIQYLFFTLKNATADKGEVKKPESIFISDAIFDRDTYEYQNNISCEYHEQIDTGKYCALSSVVRWGFMFSDYMCYDLAVRMIPGAHLPMEADLSAGVNSARNSNFDDAKSVVSTSARSYAASSVHTNLTQPKMERRYVDDSKSDIVSVTTSMASDLRKRGHVPSRAGNPSDDDEVDDEEVEESPWASRSKNKPRLPNEDSFSFSSVVIGRGRGLKTETNSATSSTVSRTSGRGRLFDQ